MRVNSQSEAGFTLIELLVVLVLFGMLSVTLFAALRLGSMTLNRVTIWQARGAELANSEEVLRRNLAAAYPEYVAPVVPGTLGRIDFDGEQDGISFLTTAPMSISSGGLVRMKISVQTTGITKALLISTQPELAWPDAHDTTQETLIAGFSSVDFAYWGADLPQQPAYWHASWSNRGALPALIRVVVNFPAADRRRWPELLIAAMISTDEGCQFSSLTQSCLGR